MPGEPEAIAPRATETSAKPSKVQIEDAEWSNPENWHGGPLNLYYSKRDARAFVPKRGTELGGATPNFACAAGVAFLVGIGLFVGLVYWLNG